MLNSQPPPSSLYSEVKKWKLISHLTCLILACIIIIFNIVIVFRRNRLEKCCCQLFWRFRYRRLCQPWGLQIKHHCFLIALSFTLSLHSLSLYTLSLHSLSLHSLSTLSLSTLSLSTLSLYTLFLFPFPLSFCLSDRWMKVIRIWVLVPTGTSPAVPGPSPESRAGPPFPILDFKIGGPIKNTHLKKDIKIESFQVYLSMFWH